MNETCTHVDLVGKRAAVLLWWIPASALLLSGLFAQGSWVLGVVWPSSLVVMGGACLANARGCGRVHCYFTGPFFLLMAVASLFHGFDLLPLGQRGWESLGLALLVGTPILYLLPERLWGRYRRVPNAAMSADPLAPPMGGSGNAADGNSAWTNGHFAAHRRGGHGRR